MLYLWRKDQDINVLVVEEKERWDGERKKEERRKMEKVKKIGDGVEDDFCFARPEMEGKARQTEESNEMWWDEMMADTTVLTGEGAYRDWAGSLIWGVIIGYWVI